MSDVPEANATPDEAYDLGRVAGYDEAKAEDHDALEAMNRKCREYRNKWAKAEREVAKLESSQLVDKASAGLKKHLVEFHGEDCSFEAVDRITELESALAALRREIAGLETEVANARVGETWQMERANKAEAQVLERDALIERAEKPLPEMETQE